MIEIISKKFKASDTDQRFMDWCAEVERDEPKTWKGHTIEDIVVMENTSIYCTSENVEKIRCWGLIRILQMQIYQI